MPDQNADDFCFYSQLSVAESRDQLKVLISKALASLGLNRFRFLALGVSKPKQLSNWPKELLGLYERFFAFDFIVQEGAKHRLPESGKR